MSTTQYTTTNLELRNSNPDGSEGAGLAHSTEGLFLLHVKELAADFLARLTALNESHYNAFLQLAELRTELGDAEGAAEAMDAAVLIYPYEVELHNRLAQAHEARGDVVGAVRERRAILALAPADLAGAYYDLALAYVAAGDPAQARRAVLRALEIAPNFSAGLELLLDLRSGAASDRPDGRVSPAGAPSR